MNVSGSRSEKILDFLSLDGWLPAQNATALGSARVKELSSVVEKGRSFRNVTATAESPAQLLKSPTKQWQAKSESFGSVAVKGMVLSVHDTYSTIKRIPARIEITASKDEPDKQSLDHLINNSLMRIEDDLPTSSDLAQFVHQMLWTQSVVMKPPAQTPIQLINVVPISKTPLESTLNVSLAPWHFERMRSPEKLAVFHANMQQKTKDSKVSSIFGHHIIENIKSTVENLPTGMNCDVSFPGVPFDILSSKLSDETNEVSKLKTTLDAKLENARSLGAAANASDANKKKVKTSKGSKTKKKSTGANTTSVDAERNEKSKKKSTKAGKQNIGLTDTGETLDSVDKNGGMIDDEHENSDDKSEKKGSSVKRREGMKVDAGWDAEDNQDQETGASDGDAELVDEENQKTTSMLPEQHKKSLYKKVPKLVQKSADAGLNLDAEGTKSLTNSELLMKLKYTLTSAHKFAGNVAQLMSAHQALAHADVYLADLKSRISGFGIVGHAERPVLVAFRQGSYKLNTTKGNMCMIMRMFPEAVDLYSRAFEFCDWMPEVLFLRAQAHLKKGDIANAQKDLETAKSIVRDGFVEKSQNPLQFQFQNNTYMSLVESLSDSIAAAQSALTAFDDEEAHGGKNASKRQALVQPTPSTAIILDGSGSHEDWPRNRVFMLASECDSMIHSGFSEDVVKKCDALLAEDNAIGLVWALRGRALLVLGKIEEGLRNINRGVTCWGVCYECRLYRALAYRQSDPSAAESDLDLCTQMSCCGAIVYILRASIKENLHRNADAAIDWELASRKDATRRNEYRYRACKLLFEDNRRSDCLHMLERLRSSSPHYIPTYLLHSDLLVKMANHRGAVNTLSRALMIEPWNPLLFFKRAQVLLLNDRSEDSMRDLVMFFKLHSVVKQGFKNDDENSAKTALRLEISMIELHCKALIALQYWQDVILLLQQNEKLVSESCSLQVKEFAQLFVKLDYC
jgi:tetratricopeptide (TPR) repeat protein